MDQEVVIGKYTLESLTNGMYASPMDIYREYIQNSVDSIDNLIRKKTEVVEKLCIEITINKAKNIVLIHDNGMGIMAQEAVKTLIDIGNSTKNYASSRGFRGIGRLAGLSYCQKLTFKTSYLGEDIVTIVEFDAALLKEILVPGDSKNITVSDTINRIISIRTGEEAIEQHYFEVKLEGVYKEGKLTDEVEVRNYLIQNAPLAFSPDFEWRHTINEKIKINGYEVPQYQIFLNGEALFKPYNDEFRSDRMRRNLDSIQDIQIETFYEDGEINAILWYALTNFYGTVSDKCIKGIRIRQGNILIGNRGSFANFFKEKRFNGWIIGELYIIDKDIIANSRRDGFEKNTAYYNLEKNLRGWTADITKYIRHILYERSLSFSQQAIVENEKLEDLNGINSLYSDEFDYLKNLEESNFLDCSESEEVVESDLFLKLNSLFDKNKLQTKYTAININNNLTIEQRKVLERVFDLIVREYDNEMADQFINTIIKNF